MCSFTLLQITKATQRKLPALCRYKSINQFTKFRRQIILLCYWLVQVRLNLILRACHFIIIFVALFFCYSCRSTLLTFLIFCTFIDLFECDIVTLARITANTIFDIVISSCRCAVFLYYKLQNDISSNDDNFYFVSSSSSSS